MSIEPLSALSQQDGISNVLLLGSKFDESVPHSWSALLEAGPPDTLATIAVSFSLPPDRMLSHYEELLEELPATLQLVSVGEQARLASTGQSIESYPDNHGVASDTRLRTVPTHTDLTELGVQLTESLNEIAEYDGLEAKTLCFSSLTPLLLHAEDSTVLKFLQVLRGQLSTHGVVGHFHFNPNPYDSDTLALLRTAFDVVVDTTNAEVEVSPVV